MTERALFNRRYTSYTPNGTPVWLINGAGVTTTPITTQSLVASEDLIQGETVFVSGTWAVPATAASGASNVEYYPVGLTAEAAFQNATVQIVLDDVAVVTSTNITADSSLVPGELYYLSKYKGEITRFQNASGTVVRASGYGAVVPVGTALSTSELHVEIGTPVILTA
jgi:ABC-type molybdate transport system substrate-binding protein